MYLVDTPGVLSPKLGDVETGMKLALCGEVEAVAGGGLPRCGFELRLGLVPEAGAGVCCSRPPQASACCLGAHGWYVGGTRGGPGLGAGLGGAGD